MSTGVATPAGAIGPAGAAGAAGLASVTQVTTNTAITAGKVYFVNGPLISTGDPYFSNVQLLMHGTALTDNSSFGRTITNNGATVNAAIAGSINSGVYDFNGTTGYMTLANVSAYNPVTGAWTLEARIRCTDVSVERVIMGQATVWTADVNWLLEQRATGDLRIYCGDSVPGQVFSGGGALSNNTWYKVMVSYDGTTLRLFKDGVLIGSQSISLNLSTTSGIFVGRDPTASASFWKGQIEEIRYTVGTCRQTASYTPETSPFDNASKTVTLTLPAAPANSDAAMILNRSTYIVLNPNGGNIEGSTASYVINADGIYSIVYSSGDSTWRVIH